MSSPAHATTYTKDLPFLAQVVENRLLCRPGSGKETRHVVVRIAGSGLTYKPGDSLGVFPTNNPTLVAEMLQWLGTSGDEPVMLPRAAEPTPLRAALAEKLSLTHPSRKLLELLAARATDADQRATLTKLLAPEATEILNAYLHVREIVDVVTEFPSARVAPQEIVDQLRRMMPRLYSIASSPLAHPDEVHLTVAIVRYTTNGRPRGGVCSTFLADRVDPENSRVPVFVANSHFGLPEDDAADIIMVGPGTGVAPFRAFVQERAARRASGRNWLFFGEQKRACDFLYEEDFTGWHQRGVLHRLETAFSRDQAHKIYVQHRMHEQAAELWRWLQAGAYFYVCGDARMMARDVDQALHEIIAVQGKMTPEQAAEFVKALKRDKRYQRDVY